jgi:hypothetical protein
MCALFQALLPGRERVAHVSHGPVPMGDMTMYISLAISVSYCSICEPSSYSSEPILLCTMRS